MRAVILSGVGAPFAPTASKDPEDSRTLIELCLFLATNYEANFRRATRVLPIARRFANLTLRLV